jgi:type IV fimbrial biogenesis protein FimT
VAPDWEDPNQYRQVTFMTFGAPPYELASVEFINTTGAAQPFADVCFTPRGQSYIRFAAGTPLSSLVGVPRVTVRNTNTNMLRSVLVPPNGVARMAL